MEKVEDIYYFEYGQALTRMSKHRNVAQFIKKIKIAVALDSTLFIAAYKFPVIAIGKGAKKSTVLGELFVLRKAGLKSLQRIFKKGFVDARLTKVRIRYVDIYKLAENREQTESKERTVFTFGIPFDNAIEYVSEGILRVSQNNSYNSEISDIAASLGKRFRKKTYRMVRIEDNDEDEDD